MQKFILYTDGGARGNPGPAGIGIAIYSADHQLLKTIKEHIGSTTNNQAEYRALLKGLSEAMALGASELLCYLDSELVVKQLTGKYKIKEPGMRDLAAQVLALTAKFRRVDFKHVVREKNKLADQLVNQALDEAGF